MIGIDNNFIIKNIFGLDNVFDKSKIYNINWQYSSRRMELELLINSMVKNPPKKWKKSDEVYIKVEFFGIQDIKIDIDYSESVIELWDIVEEDGKFVLCIHLINKKVIRIRYEIAHIQNITPFNNADNNIN